MPNLRVCALFRPLNSIEKSDHGDSVCIRSIDSESFVFKDEKEEEVEFQFDKVFYQGSEQADVYEFLALPIVEGAVNGVNGAIITYGQTGAGKTYSMEGPSVTGSDEKQKGLLKRSVDGLFNIVKQSNDITKYTIKLSMVEIYMERVRSSKLILVDLAGSEKQEKTGAEGKVLEEAKTINKSLSALGNVINALTCASPARANHIPYRDSKLTRILQDALGGNSHTALLCCCSPSPANASESLSTLRFGARAKHIKAVPRVSLKEEVDSSSNSGALSLTKDESCERILEKLRQRMKAEDVDLLEQLFILEGIILDSDSVEEVESAYEDVTSRRISLLQKTVEELTITNEKLKKENRILKGMIKSY